MGLREVLEKNMRAEAYFEKDGVCYIKARLWGMAISGITVRPSKKFDELWVQMPMFKAGGQFRRYVEFDKDENGETFKDVIETKARLAAEAYQGASASPNS
jgi:hypothetical protein